MTDLVRTLKALADETRFKIINLLLRQDLCVRALAHCLELSDAAVSQHLGVLRRQGLVKGEKRGYWTHYSVDRERLLEVTDELKRIAGESTDGRPGQ